MGKTTQKMINGIVWKACDTFRGTLSSDRYKDYILTMLFVKFLSDFYKEKYAMLKDKHGDNQQRIDKSLALEKFKLDEECTFEYLLASKEVDNLGEVINKALEKIEEDNPEKLSGIFRSIDFNSEIDLGSTKDKNVILRNLIEDFSDKRLDLRPSMLEGNDVLGDSYEFLISRFASDAGKKGGDFFTPKEVSSLLARLVGAKEGDRIYDPTCGSGSLLIKSAKEVGNKNFAIYGQEKNGQTHTLSRMNMFLHEITDANIQRGDTLRNPLHLEDNDLMSFDVVVANPPFSLDKWGCEDLSNDRYKRFAYGMPPKSKGDYAFVMHMLASLNMKGRMGIVLPHGVLFRGASEGRIRKQMIVDNLLDGVIGLPANLFFGTSIPACILILKKDRDKKDIMFIDASKEFEKEKNQNKLNEVHIEKIMKAYQGRKDIDKYAYVAKLKEVQDNEYNLNIPRYVDTFEEEEEVDIKETMRNIEKVEKELKDINGEIGEYLKELGI